MLCQKGKRWGKQGKSWCFLKLAVEKTLNIIFSQRYKVASMLAEDIVLLDKFENHLTETLSKDTLGEEKM